MRIKNSKKTSNSEVGILLQRAPFQKFHAFHFCAPVFIGGSGVFRGPRTGAGTHLVGALRFGGGGVVPRHAGLRLLLPQLDDGPQRERELPAVHEEPRPGGAEVHHHPVLRGTVVGGGPEPLQRPTATASETPNDGADNFWHFTNASFLAI